MNPSKIQEEIHHFCKCNVVEQCMIFVHPSKKIQELLNELMSAIAEWDDNTESQSRFQLTSIYEDGIFDSITKNEKFVIPS